MADKNDLTGDDPSVENDDDVQLSGCGATPCCDPRRAVHRFVVLIFICFLSFGSYFCFDNPSALQKQITNVSTIITYLIFVF